MSRKVESAIFLPAGRGEITVTDDDAGVRHIEYAGPLPRDLAEELVRRSREYVAAGNVRLLSEAMRVPVYPEALNRVSDTSG